MNGYSTAKIAAQIGIHPNTVRLYEDLQLIPKAQRKPNGYRLFTDRHLEQLKLVRLALRAEVTQNGLRKKAILIVKTAASGELKDAEGLSEEYIAQIRAERQNAEDAIRIAKNLLRETENAEAILYRRKEAAEHLQITVDTLRNWELNGLLTVKRRENGYRVYDSADILRLKLIRSLRCANYSLSSILRMLKAMDVKRETDLREVLDTPGDTEEIVSVCDRLLTSLANLETDAEQILLLCRDMRKRFCES